MNIKSWKIYKFLKMRKEKKAAKEAEKNKNKKKKGRIRENLEVIFSAVVIAVLIRIFILDNYEIPTGSMIPNLIEGDRLFVTKFTYGVRLPILPNWKLPAFSSPERGDIAIFQYPLYRSPGEIKEILDLFTFSVFGLDPKPKNFVKRVIGIPGDLIRLNEDGELFLNGKKVKRKFYQERLVRSFPVGDNKRRVVMYVHGKKRRYNKKLYEYTKRGMDFDKMEYRLYKENGRVVQYRSIPREYLGQVAELLRPYPPKLQSATYYEMLADKYFIQNMLQKNSGEVTMVVIDENYAKKLEKKDIHLLIYNKFGEVWYRLRGQKKKPLFIRKKGHLWVVVPENHYFMLGDNRDMSADSRDWGFVEEGFIMGTPLVRYWPFSRFGSID